MAKVTKTSVVIQIMTDNKDKPMSEVVSLIEAGLPCREGYGKVWYRWAIKEGVAPGKIESGRTAKAKKEPKAKVAKDKTKKFTGKIKVKAEPKVESKNLSDDEVAKIKAANLKKMKEITAKQKYLPGQVAKPQQGNGDGPVRTRADAAKWIKAEEKRIDEEMRERDYPKFLSKDQAKLLVG